MAELSPVCPKAGAVHLAGLAVSVKTFRTPEMRWIFYRCTCGHEWTAHERETDRSQPVSGDEVLSVHEQLQAWDGKLTDLLEVKP